MANALAGYYPPSDGDYYHQSLQDALNSADESYFRALYGAEDAARQPGNFQNFVDEMRAARNARQFERDAPQNAANVLAYATPGIGNVLSARDAYEGALNRNWLAAGLGILGAIPIVGYASKFVKGARALRPETEAINYASRSANIYNPPPKPARMIAMDYPEGVPADAMGRITHDMEGRPLRSAFIAGRSGGNGAAETAIAPAQYDAISEGLFGSLPESVAAREIGGDAGKFIMRPSATGDRTEYFVKSSKALPPQKQARVQAHEIAHGIDEISGRIDTSNLRRELQAVYHDLNNQDLSPRAKSWTPEAAGYKGADVDREYMSEAIRAYMTDPNYMKTVAPKTAAAIRAAVNSNPRLSKTVQFNSLAPLLAGATGYGAYNSMTNGQ